ncbi:MAG TPA: hypothetical protein VMU10_10395 [Desulfomonilia bacterium]|nr:hypothetical protein [Desulfomonilia bacterium]
MLKSKWFWYLMMAGAVIGWIFTVFGLIKPIKNETIRKLWKSVAFTWLFGHPLEFLVSRGVCAAAGIAPRKALIKTLVYGITWWIPVKLGVLES